MCLFTGFELGRMFMDIYCYHNYFLELIIMHIIGVIDRHIFGKLLYLFTTRINLHHTDLLTTGPGTHRLT